jgi:Secretion system C-terminal sorting domain
MKRIFTFLVFLFVSAQAFAVTKTWNGGAGPADYATAANWLPSGVPGTTDDIIVQDDATITFNSSVVGFNSVTIKSGKIVTFSNLNAATNLTIGSTLPWVLTIESDATLNVVNNTTNTSRGLLLKTKGGLVDVGATINLVSGNNSKIDNVTSPFVVNGSYRVGTTSTGGDAGNSTTTTVQFQFGPNSFFYMRRTNGGTILNATWDASSTIDIDIPGTAPSFSLAGISPYSFGNYKYKASNMTTAVGLFSTSICTFKGNVEFISTGSINCRLSTATSGTPITIDGNLTVTGGTVFGFNSITTSGTILVKGNLNVAMGATYGLNIVNGGTPKIEVRGNVDVDGTLTSGQPNIAVPVISNTGTLLMTGTSAQTIKVATLGPNYIAFSPTNAAGVTLLSDITLMRATTLGVNTNLFLGNFNYTVPATGIPSGGAPNHIVTDGTGKLKVSSAAAGVAASFPIGVSATSYDPVYVKPTNSVDIAVKVSSIFTNTVADLTKIAAREYDITPTGTPGSTAIDFEPSATSYTAAATTGTIVIGHYGVAWEEYPAIYDGGIWSIAAYTGTFSPFGAGQAGGFLSAPLAVDLKSINAYGKGNNNMVEWSTANEKNMKEYIVERSTDGINAWEAVAKQAATNSVDAKYLVEDATASALSFYRVKSVELGGKAEVSKVVSVKRDNRGKLNIQRVFPMPMAEAVQMDFEATANGKVQVTVTDIVGKVVSNQNVEAVQGLNRLDLNMNSLPSGAYILSLKENNSVVTQRVVKQ